MQVFFQDCILGKTPSSARCPPWPNICCLPGEGILDRKVMLHWAATILTPEPLSTASEFSYYFLKYDNAEKTALTAVIHLAWLCLVLAVVLHLFPALCVERESERAVLPCSFTWMDDLHWLPITYTSTFNLICFTVASLVPSGNIIWSTVV